MKKKITITIFFISLFFPCFFLQCIEVGGHISEDTTWSPENNPYIVTHNLFVDSDVTLTILPGTVVEVYSALVIDNDPIDFYWQNGESVAKMIWVDGRIIAEGTEEDSIVFTRYQDDESNYRWGCIFFPEGSPESIFRYCEIKHTYKNVMNIGYGFQGALCSWNGRVRVENCEFENNYIAIWLENTTEPMMIYKNTFRNNSIYPTNLTPIYISLNNTDAFLEHNLLVARNKFLYRGSIFLTDANYLIDFVYNYMDSVHISVNRPDQGVMISYGNVVLNSGFGSGGISFSENDTCYVLKNTVINSNGVGISGYHGVIADNYIENNDEQYSVRARCDSSNIVYNNIVKDCIYRAINTEGAYSEIYNNIIINNYMSPIVSEVDYLHLFNNVIYNTRYAFFYQDFPMLVENNIFLTTEGIIAPNGHDENALFRNNCLTYPLPAGVTDGGGNIFDNPLFADTLNRDFHLLPGSPCIDAGYDTTYTSTFDADYFHRVIDGLNDGNAIIDMGAFEFGSSFIGGIRGYVYQSENGESLDIVKLKINGKPPEYSDSLGFFEFKLNEGTYNIQCSRFYYDDIILNGIEVIDGEFTDIEIYMDETVQVDEQEEISNFKFLISNFPNPFSSSTTISFQFSNEQNEQIKLEIYNIKGQKVKTFKNQQIIKSPNNQILWDGTDENNNPVSTGIYLYRLKTNNLNINNKMLYLK